MSNQLPSNNDKVVVALDLEQQITRNLEAGADDSTRKEVRRKMEEWMKLMGNAKIRREYAEQLGELDPKRAEVELLSAIQKRFPKVAKELGWNEELVAQYQHSEDTLDQAA